MRIERHSAWRFIHPDFDAPAESRGIIVTPAGQIALAQGAASIRQAILLLLSTVPGERLRRPDYGCELHRLVFSPNDETTHGLAIHYIERALARWEPRVDVLNIDAERDPSSPQLLQVTLVYRVRRAQEEEQLSFAFNLQSMDD